MFRIHPCGDTTLLVSFDGAPDAGMTSRLAGMVETLRVIPRSGITDIVPAFTTLTVFFDPAVMDRRTLSALIGEAASTATHASFTPAHHDIPVRYGGEAGPDLTWVSASLGISADEIIEKHTSHDYIVYLLGFSPGFAYLGDLPPALALPRRAVPRPSVPPGSVAIATSYTAVYPQATAGGWHLIGRTDVRFFDANADCPALLRTGDRVRFVAM